MNNWPRYNWERWKSRRAKELGLRLIVSPPAPFVNPYPCALGLVPAPERLAAIGRELDRAFTDDEPGAA